MANFMQTYLFGRTDQQSSILYTCCACSRASYCLEDLQYHQCPSSFETDAAVKNLQESNQLWQQPADPQVQQAEFQLLNQQSYAVLQQQHPDLQQQRSVLQQLPVSMSQPPPDSESQDLDCMELWPDQAIRIMIEEFRRNDQAIQLKTKKKREVYEKIQSELKVKLNIVRALTQIKNKWKYLMDQYKTEADRRKRTGEDNDPFTERFEYFTEFDDLFGKNPTLNPPVTFSSRAGRKKNLVLKVKKTKGKENNAEVEVAEMPGPSKEAVPGSSKELVPKPHDVSVPKPRDVWDEVAEIYGYGNSDGETVDDDETVRGKGKGVVKKGKAKEKKKPAVAQRRTAANAFITYLEMSSEKKEEKRQKRHEEKTEVMKGFLNTFEKLNNNLEGILKPPVAGNSQDDSD